MKEEWFAANRQRRGAYHFAEAQRILHWRGSAIQVLY